jgi:hypothetical protein
VRHPGAWSWWPHPGPLTAGRRSHLFGPSLSGGEVHHQDPLCLKRGLVLWRHMWLNHGSGLLTGELALPWHRLLLGGGLPSTSLHLMPSTMSVTPLNGEVGFWPWHNSLHGNRHHGLMRTSILWLQSFLPLRYLALSHDHEHNN